MKTGSCLCGKVSWRAGGALRPVIYCHCKQCRKQSGHFVAATRSDDADLTVDGSENLTWYAASDTAKRGFCAACGSLLFWKLDGADKTSIMAGSIDDDTGLSAQAHIFCEDKGSYYAISDGLPQYKQSD